MKRFLYITPFFPPLRRVGALDPLKITRHLPGFGWSPVVLADLWPGAATDSALLNAVPDTVVVARRFSGRAERVADIASKNEDHAGRSWFPRLRAPAFLARQEWLPLGEMGFYINRAVREGETLIREHGCSLVVAQASPNAALVVGRILSEKLGLPLVCLLGDPWGPCALKGPGRPPHSRLVIRRAERRVVARAARVVLYTERAVEDYRVRYLDQPPSKFLAIHNGFDEALCSEPWTGSLPWPNLLFFGTYSEFITPEPAIRLLGTLKERGDGVSDFHFVSTAEIPERDMRLARALGVEDRIVVIGHQPYGQSQAILKKATVLLAFNATPQRIVAKTYDYIRARRPILSIGPPHRQLSDMLDNLQIGECLRPDDYAGMAEFCKACRAGRYDPEPAAYDRRLAAYSFRPAAEIIAASFDRALGGR